MRLTKATFRIENSRFGESDVIELSIPRLDSRPDQIHVQWREPCGKEIEAPGRIFNLQIEEECETTARLILDYTRDALGDSLSREFRESDVHALSDLLLLLGSF